MVRSRSKSVVQSIASDVATYSKNNVWLATESKEARNVHNPVLPDQTPNVFRHRTRSRSLSDAYVSKQEVKSLEKALSEVSIPLFPFSAAEEEALLHSYLASINYNSVLDSNHINDINNFSDNSVLAFCSECNANASYVQSLLDEGRGVMNKLSALTLHYETVMKETDDFAFHSTQLLNQQRVLEHKTAAMGQIIQVFEPLDSISATLVSSGNSILKTGKIESILVQLQENLDFLAAHPSYKDAEKYSMRYRQCMTRGLTLVMNYLVKIFRAKFVDVSARLNSKPPPSTLNLDIMMYSEFTNDLERLTDKTKVPFLIGLMVERCMTHSEYLGLLSDVFLEYFKLRHALILAHLQAQPIKDDTLSTVQYCQRLTSTYKRLVEKEYALFIKHFPFKTYSDLVQKHINDCLFSFLRQVLDPFYDDMRNRILRETRIAELCQLTNLLDSYYEFDELTSMVSGIQESSIEYGELFEPIMNDAQARLIFRIQNFIDNKLLTYKTKPEDLQLANRKKSNDLEPKHALQSEYGENFFPELYYPVGIAFSILSQLYELVSPMVFDDMAHYIVHSCITMLKNGALKLAISHLGTVEARFFYLKNLLMLNSQFDHFEIQYVRTETSLDFTSGILELLNILRQGTLYVNLNTKGGFLELVKRSAPRVINDMMDAKKEIEMELSNTINEIVTECANIICKPILGNDTRDAKAKCVELSDNILMKVPQLHKLMRVFVAEPEIVSFLLQELAILMLRTYETFFKKLAYEFAGLANVEILNEIMEPSALFHFFNETVANLQEQEGETVNFHESFLKDLSSEGTF
ncbi:hypothetical protein METBISCDRAFT_23218 [Metschnikowia bicuspidata]|uniref:Conserved oligomeric Golgi complex subunit 3 n=1 Tax=Metschnikowia bicuspidata TaxID=27322 RepID=A0A4P9ZCF7_9ASCO|nr:hypothetical protein METBISCDRAFT_23218 [Metschnikowia bicuspidata]